MFLVNLCSFSAGITYGWTSPILPKLNGSVDPENNPLNSGSLTTTEESWVASLLSLGSVIGPFIFGPLADRIGRRTALLFSAVPLSLHYIGAAFAREVWQLYISRFIGGIAIAAVYTIVPVYLGEITDAGIRGAVSVAMPTSASTGVLFAFCAGPYLSIMTFNLICGVIPIVFIALAIVLVPESPHYLLAKQKWTLAENALIYLRGVALKEERELLVRMEMLDIEKSIKENSKQLTYWQVLAETGTIRKGLIISCGIMFFQQASGNMAVLTYMQSMFEAADINISPEIAVILIGIIQVGFSLVASLLTDKLGRKLLLLTSLLGVGVAQTTQGVFFHLKATHRPVETVSWLPIFAAVLFTISYSLGLGTVSWVIVGELFPRQARSKASSLAADFCFIQAFITSLVFPHLVEAIGMGLTFWMFAVCCGFGMVFVYLKMPETKGRTLWEIQELLENK